MPAVHRPNPQRRKEVDAVRRAALLFAGATIWLFLLAIPAMADNGPHVAGQNSTALQGSCAGCHRAHSGQAPYLVKATMPTLCYSCHGAGGAGATTDVQDGVAYAATSTPHAGTLGVSGGTSVSLTSVAGALRGGGFQYALINTNPSGGVTQDSNRTIGVLAAGAVTTSSHSVDGTPVTMWGAGNLGNPGVGTTNVDLTCASCHDPHGNGQYRILKPLPDDATTGTAAVKIIDATAGTSMVYTTTNYWLSGDSNVPVDATAPLTGTAKAANPTAGTYADIAADGYINNIAAWCTTCHTRYLASSNSHKTNSGDATFTYRHRSDVNYKSAGANCITCHVAHGTNAQMTTGGNSAGVSLPGGGTAVGLKGAADSRLLRVDNRGICIMCHNV